MLGYARSIERDGTRELTEFFVHPTAQAGGIGRELLARAFPADGARHRSIIATTDVRAVSRYLREGLDARLPLAGFEAAPRAVALETDLVREPIVATERTLEALGAIDRAVLGFRRDVDHALARDRATGLALPPSRRGRRLRLSPDPTVVGRAVRRARRGRPAGPPGRRRDAPRSRPGTRPCRSTSRSSRGRRSITCSGRGFRVDPFMMLFFTDGPVDGLDRYVLTSPPFFL